MEVQYRTTLSQRHLEHSDYSVEASLVMQNASRGERSENQESEI